MQEYRCKHCGYFLCQTDRTEGRITLWCPNRRCPQRRQTIDLAREQPPKVTAKLH